MITDAEWLGLLMRSESDQPHEWSAIGWAVRNRVEATSGEFRRVSTYPGVILQPKQFSYFNPWTAIGQPEAFTFEQALDGYAGEEAGWSANNYTQAVECARWLLGLPRWRAPFGPGVQWYWSPVSMRPKGSAPVWATSLQWLQAPGVDPWRFTFAQKREAPEGFELTA